MTIKEIFAAWMELYYWHEHPALTRLEYAVQEVIDAKDARIAELLHVIFELIIAPNCGTCSDQMTARCDNGIRCMEKVLSGEFIRYDELKKNTRLSTLEAENAQLRADKAELVAAADEVLDAIWEAENGFSDDEKYLHELIEKSYKRR